MDVQRNGAAVAFVGSVFASAGASGPGAVATEQVGGGLRGEKVGVVRSSNTPLVDAVKRAGERVNAAFFCPGHKRGKGASAPALDLIGARAFHHDLPEIPELDNLFAPEGVIQDAEAEAAAAFGVKQTFFLINGSTAGVIASIVATARTGRKKVLLPRNVHQSAVHALVVSGLEGIFLSPVYSPKEDILHGLTVQAVEDALNEHENEIGAVLIVSPTYHGVTSDLSGLARVAHAKGALLIVDEAHGAHNVAHEKLPIPATKSGADIVIQSTHKTLGSLTQTAMMHMSHDCPVPESDIRASLQLVQSTSPSYLLLSSLDAARAHVFSAGPAIYENVIAIAEQARRSINEIEGLFVMTKPESMMEMDPTRLTVCIDGLPCNGFDADDYLVEEHGVYAELPGLRHITFILSIGTTENDARLLVNSLRALSDKYCSIVASSEPHDDETEVVAFEGQPSFGQQVISAREAFFSAKEMVPLNESVGRISAATVCPYPPGIPVLLPGEKVTASCLEYLDIVSRAGAKVTGGEEGVISCVK